MGTTWEQGPKEPHGRRARPRVLVIDDDEHVREILIDALTRVATRSRRRRTVRPRSSS